MAEKKKAAPVEEQVSGGTRALVFLVLALVAGAAATILIYQVVQSYKARIAEATKPEETQWVIIASGELFPGLQITENDIVGIEVPKKYAPEDAFSSPELVVGAIPRERILPNEFIRPDRLADADSGIGLNALVPSGMRAVSLNISGAKALSGFLQPGNRVDVLVTITDKDSGKLETLTALQTVPVLAVNATMIQSAKAEAEAEAAARAAAEAAKKAGKKVKKTKPTKAKGAPTVTLALTPDQAEILVHAQQIGNVTLTLRSDGDIAQAEAAGINTSELLGENEPPPVAAAPVAKAKPKVEPPKEQGVTLSIIRGSKTTTKTY